MKRLIRTIPGKVSLFLATLLSASILTGCIFGVFFMVEEDFYVASREALQEQVLNSEIRSDAIQMVGEMAWYQQNGEEVPDRSIDDTALRCVVLDENGKVVLKSEGEKFNPGREYPFQYTIGADGSREAVHFYGDGVPSAEYLRELAAEDGLSIYTFYGYLDTTVTEAADYSQWTHVIDTLYSARYGIIVLGVVMGLVCIASFVTLMCVSGRRPDTDKLVPGPLNRVPSDVILGIGALALSCICVAVTNNFYPNDYVLLCLIVIAILAGAAIILGLCMSIACRIKQRSLLRNTVIWRLCKLCWRGLKALWRGMKRFGRWFIRAVRQLPMIWRTCLIFAGVCFLELIVIGMTWYDQGSYFFFWVVGHIILAGVLLFGALTLRRLQKAGEALADGDLSYQVDTTRMYWDFKRHGENLNNIADGMTRAVEQRMKSERMKTELITNVSHDIKTPLTSIINYADLITKEKCDNPKIGEYAEVLGRQSDRLKRLIEDLVEASKASTGNLEVLLAPCDAENFLVQISGEYEHKLADAGLELVTKIPENSLRVMADGRRMLRVFDNLMNNICKYAQRGTRVYLTLEEKGVMAVITFRNTSRDPLNLTPEELMERFVQGDASRSGEGNGLGLSIARSLTELQNGTFQLDVDGDLFKVTLRFPLLPDEG